MTFALLLDLLGGLGGTVDGLLGTGGEGGTFLNETNFV